MGRCIMVVRFPDNSIKLGIYNETADQAEPRLFDTSEEAWAWWHDAYENDTVEYLGPDRVGEGQEVEVCNGIWTWNARATAEWFLPPYATEDLPLRNELPEWYVAVFS